MLHGRFLTYVLLRPIADGDAWEDRWVHSTAKGSDAGKFVLTAGKFYGDAEKDKGRLYSESFALCVCGTNWCYNVLYAYSELYF